MGNRIAMLVARSIPWFAALAYLSLIGHLGLSFQRIEQWQVTQLVAHISPGHTAPVDLPFFRRSEEVSPSTRLSLEFSPIENSSPMALFLPRLSSDLRVTVNGSEVRAPSLSSHPKQINTPMLVPLPGQLLRPGHVEELSIDLLGYTEAAFLSRFYLGPRAELEPVYRSFHFFRHELIRVAFTVTLMMAFFIGLIWSVRRQFNEYGWLSLSFLAFTYYLYNFVGTTQATYVELQTWSFLVARAIFICAFVCFVHQFLSLRRRRFELIAAGFFAIVFALGLCLVAADRYEDFLSLTYVSSLPAVLLLIGYVCALLVKALHRSGHVYLHWLLVGSLLGLLLGLHDLMVLFDAQHWLFRDFFISHYASLFMAIGLGGVLVHRVAHALFNSEDLNLELNRLLQEKVGELERVAEQRQQQARQLTLHAERQRIMSDMHDGIGGQLVSLIAAHRERRLDDQAMERELELILVDLRLILDAMSPAGEELLDALGRLRERCAPVLKCASIQLRWQIDPHIESLPMAPGQTINVLRFVQEALQNCVKHAHARSVCLILAPHERGYRLSIRDDGVGGAAVLDGQGAGLGSRTMQRRALAMGGTLEVHTPATGGTEVTLVFPDPDCPKP